MFDLLPYDAQTYLIAADYEEEFGDVVKAAALRDSLEPMDAHDESAYEFGDCDGSGDASGWGHDGFGYGMGNDNIMGCGVGVACGCGWGDGEGWGAGGGEGTTYTVDARTYCPHCSGSGCDNNWDEY